MDTFEKHSMKVLCPGSYVFFTNVTEFMKWSHALSKHKCGVFEYPACFIKKRVTGRDPTGFSHNNSEMALICKAPGTHPDKFKPSFRDTLMVGEKSSRINASDCIPPAINGLLRPESNSQLRLEEKNL